MRHSFTRRYFVTSCALAGGAFGVSSSLQSQGLRALAGKSPARSLRTVGYRQVKITGDFWRRKQEKVANRTLPACIAQTEKSGRVRNFEKAARRGAEEHEGEFFNDSDVYKVIEAIAYSLGTQSGGALERKADDWIDKIASAQLADGYLNTYYTLTGLEKRWTDMDKHEDYCAGHLIEAAIAYYQATGKRRLLDVAIRFADHIDNTFRVSDRKWVSGHEEIELALMKLYRVTHEKRYLALADRYLQLRGRVPEKVACWGLGLDYCQASVPIKEQRRITGHAVCAMYLYSAVTDVTAEIHDGAYRETLDAVWEDVVYRNMYLTGGIGAATDGEGFSKDAYGLPNEQAYCETCASCGMVFWNQRMNLLTGDSKYIDVLERSLYNGALDGISLTGDRFFYVNPLASSESNPGRQEWFGTACCPSNISRLITSLGGYLYCVSDRGIWVNLCVASQATLHMGSIEVGLLVESEYPWNGAIRLTVQPKRRSRWAMRLRIPGWARNVAVPGDLYTFGGVDSGTVSVFVNGRPMRYREEKGYAVLERKWKPGDVIEMTLPMPIRTVVARQEVGADRDRIALQRGPLVYCVEGADNPSSVWNFTVPANGKLTEQPQRILDEPVIALRCEVTATEPTHDGSSEDVPQEKFVTAIPYYTWANRGNYEMQVWLPLKINRPGMDS